MTIRLRSVALPSEHGGWSLTLEPALLGLIVAPSSAGLLLALAALTAFVVRTPVRVVLVDMHRSRWLARTRLALRIAAVEAAVLAALVAGAAVISEAPFWLPLALAGPLVIAAFVFDAFSRSRRLVAEVAGSIGIASVATAIALAGGEQVGVSFGLWVIAGARAVAAIGHVRVQVRRTRRAAATRAESDWAQIAAVAGVVVGWVAGIVSAAAVAAILVLGAVHVVLVRRAPFPVAAIGAQQVVLGLAVVLTAGLAAIAP